MKNIITILLFLLSTQLFAKSELSWVDEQVAAIKPPREGISNQVISKLKSPFIFLHKTKVASQKATTSTKIYKRTRRYSSHFRLEAILNKSALINGRWYKEGVKVHGYRLKKVNLRSILLTRGKKEILLTTLSKNKNLKFNNK